ncbi:MAG TPA: outer membrane protein assembly factor BamD [Vicinamibacterales bacterium]|nr:outer membrane protein assembly factor BamD [Vicinamibacterales bacterium]|tara:strand:+ start:1204 stop:2016 length:813 start_codon:yes stop_codon:yes gene_type:complete
MRSTIVSNEQAPLTSIAVALLLTSGMACTVPDPAALPPGTPEPDRYLFEHGSALFEDENWDKAQTVFRRLVDVYPQSPYRFDAKLAIGDSLLGNGGLSSLIQAVNEFEEFLRFYPTHPRAAYAQFKIGITYSEGMLASDRDQTSTKMAIEAFDLFFELYPDSDLIDEARKWHRTARDRLSEADFRVGEFYFNGGWYPGAIQRMRAVLAEDPGYTARDAVYFVLGESLAIIGQGDEALPYFNQLVDDFEQSAYLEPARRRIAELESQEGKR